MKACKAYIIKSNTIIKFKSNNQILYCAITLKFIERNFKIIGEICERDPDKWR